MSWFLNSMKSTISHSLEATNKIWFVVSQTHSQKGNNANDQIQCLYLDQETNFIGPLPYYSLYLRFGFLNSEKARLRIDYKSGGISYEFFYLHWNADKACSNI